MQPPGFSTPKRPAKERIQVMLPPRTRVEKAVLDPEERRKSTPPPPPHVSHSAAHKVPEAPGESSPHAPYSAGAVASVTGEPEPSLKHISENQIFMPSEPPPSAPQLTPNLTSPSEGTGLAAPSKRRIAVAGNPNCGKTTLFNALTGLRQRVGNYPGVTVEKKEGTFLGSHGEALDLLDLPGCYSLQSRSPDEAVSRDVLLGRQPDTPRPDAILAVVDATNLERNLYLVSQLLELGLPVFLGLNMVDLVEKRGGVIDVPLLSEKLGIPVLPLVAPKGTGLIALKQALSQSPLPRPKFRPPLPDALRAEADKIGALLPDNGAQLSEAVLLLGLAPEQLKTLPNLSEELLSNLSAAQARLEASGLEPVSAAVDARYDWIHQICEDCVRTPESGGLTASDKLDAILTNGIWGWLAFVGAMTLMFFSIFTIAKIPTDWIAAAQSGLGGWIETLLPEGDFRSLLVDGVLAGVAGVVVFLPQILILTFFLGLLEDSGYMARAAFLMDRLMSRVGLHGKSFIPMLSSFACAIPGIMATRTIEQRKDRLVTILVAPLMSCSARLPVYTLLVAVLLPDVPAWQKSLLMLTMYLIGIVAAFAMAWLFKKTLLRSETPILLMEMPPYRAPALNGILLRMRERAWLFLKRAGTVILALSVVLWALMTYPKPSEPDATRAEQLSHSVAGRLGHALEPVIAPLGFDWKIGIGLIGSLAAREVFVSTMGIVYSVENDAPDSETTLIETMRAEKRPDGTPVYSLLTGLSLMVFYVLAMQCLSTLAVVRRETNSWLWPAFQFAYMTALAYGGAFIVYQGGRLLGLH
jgi:ferrous iron transport protein B